MFKTIKIGGKCKCCLRNVQNVIFVVSLSIFNWRLVGIMQKLCNKKVPILKKNNSLFLWWLVRKWGGILFGQPKSSPGEGYYLREGFRSLGEISQMQFLLQQLLYIFIIFIQKENKIQDRYPVK